MYYPEDEALQEDGRIRRWTKIAEMEDRYLRELLHNNPLSTATGKPNLASI